MIGKMFIIVLLYISILGIAVSCQDSQKTIEQKYREYKAKLEKEKEDSINEARYHGFEVVVIDSCEYLITIHNYSYYSYGLMSHKGNCKFCKERNGGNR